MAFSLADIKDLVGLGAETYLKKEAIKSEEKISQYEVAGQELAYKAAREKNAQAQTVAATSANLINSDMVKNIVFWTLTTIAGGVLTMVVFRAAGFK